MKRIIIAQQSDLHAGNKLGLMNLGVTLVDTQRNPPFFTPQPTESQKELWQLELENVEKVKQLAGKDDIYYIEDGDPTQGIKHQADLVSDRLADQVVIAVANSQPIYNLDNLKAAHYAVGTGAHNLGMGSTDMLIVNQLKALYPIIPINLCYHGLVHYGGFDVDYSHHGPYPGSRFHLSGNVARYYLQSLMMSHIARGEKPPDLVVRAHYHVPIFETVRLGGYTSHIVVSPSMCMVDDYTHQAAKSPDSVTVGMFAYEIVDDKLLEIHQLTKTFDTRTQYYV